MQKYCSPMLKVSVYEILLLTIKRNVLCTSQKMILLKNIENCFLVRLFAIYLLKSVLHLKYDKITVINNMQLPHYIATRAAISTGPIHQHVFAMTYRIKSLLEIYMKVLVS